MTDPENQTEPDIENLDPAIPPHTELNYVKYLILYTAALIIGGVFIMILDHIFFEGDSNDYGFIATFGAIAFISHMFTKRHKRLITKTERKKLSFGCLMIGILMYLLSIIAISSSNDPELVKTTDFVVSWVGVIIFIAFSIISYFLHYWAFGWLNKSELKNHT